jgi:hypothetical protein
MQNYGLTCVVSIEDPQGNGGKDAGEVEEHGGREGLLKRLQRNRYTLEKKIEWRDFEEGRSFSTRRM